MRGNLRIDEQRNLRHAHPQQGGQHQARHLAGGGVGPGRADGGPAHTNTGQQPQAQQRRHLDAQLQQATQHHARRLRIDGLNAVARKQGRAQRDGQDERNVEQHRRGGGHRKLLPGIENAPRQRHQRHEADVGEHPARHRDGGIKTLGGLFHATGHGPHHPGRAQHTGDAEQHQRPGEQGAYVVDQRLGAVVALLGPGGSQHRYKSLAEGALAQHAAEQVGNAERHIESVRHGTDPEDGGHEQLAHQPRDAGDEGQQGNGGGGFEQ